MSLRALVVGLGRVGMGYDLRHDPNLFVLTHARAFQTHPAFELVGGVDPASTRLALFESEYVRPGYGDLATALTDLQPDVVAIATPTVLHHQSLSAVLDVCTPQAILCEKPLAYDFEQAVAMVEACEAADIMLYVNYMRRSDRGVTEIKERIRDGRIAQPIKGVCWYSKGLLNNGSHFLNLLQYWLDEVTGFEVVSQGRLWNDIDPEPDVKVRFESGTVLFLAAREEDYSHYTIELISGNGRVRYEQGGAQILWQPVVNDPTCEGYRILHPMAETVASDLDHIQWQVADQLAASLGGQEARICSSRDALCTLEILDRIGKGL